MSRRDRVRGDTARVFVNTTLSVPHAGFGLVLERTIRTSKGHEHVLEAFARLPVDGIVKSRTER